MNKVKLLVTELDCNTVIVIVINENELLDIHYVRKLFPTDNAIMSKEHFSNMLFKLIRSHRVDIITPEVSIMELEDLIYDLR